MKLIVGLGNPGIKYSQTRHNIGFDVIEAVGGSLGQKLIMSVPFKAQIAESSLNGIRVTLMKPLTFMNLSGQAVQAAANFYKLSPTDIIVIHDEIDLPFGEIRIKAGQGAAGHNGVKSIMEFFGGSKEFTRVRVGVGRPTDGNIPVEDWVLGKWSKEEKEKLPAVIEDSVQQIKNQFFQ